MSLALALLLSAAAVGPAPGERQRKPHPERDGEPEPGLVPRHVGDVDAARYAPTPEDERQRQDKADAKRDRKAAQRLAQRMGLHRDANGDWCGPDGKDVVYRDWDGKWSARFGLGQHATQVEALQALAAHLAEVAHV